MNSETNGENKWVCGKGEAHENGHGSQFLLGLDGGATSTVCVCMPLFPFSDPNHLPDPLPILARSVAGCSNHNSVGETAARVTLEQVITEALSKSGADRSAVRAVCLGVSGVNHPTDQERILIWLREMFPSHVKLYVQNDAVAAMASGTLGKLHGCVLVSGTGSISYGFANGKEARAAGAGPILGDWGSGYGIAARALTAVIRAHDGRSSQTMLTTRILKALGLSSTDEIIGWTYADPSWARIAALVPEVVSCAEAGDQIANNILVDAVQELTISVKAVVERLKLCGEDGSASFPIVMVGGVLEGNKSWDIGNEVINSIQKLYPGAHPISPKKAELLKFDVKLINIKDDDESSSTSSYVVNLVFMVFLLKRSWQHYAHTFFSLMVEPAIGAALLAWNFLMKESEGNNHH